MPPSHETNLITGCSNAPKNQEAAQIEHGNVHISIGASRGTAGLIFAAEPRDYREEYHHWVDLCLLVALDASIQR